MAYRLSRRAKEDLIAIYVDGAAAFGVRQAEAYFARLERAFGLIADNPRIARERVEIVPPVRIHPCGAHIVIYVVEPNDDVLIVRVRHSREDWIDNPAGGDA